MALNSSCAEVLVEQNDWVLEITMDRPKRKNALTKAMYTAMAQVLHAAANDASVRSVVLSGSEGIFTSGNDLVDFLDGATAEENSPVMQFMRELYNFPKPVVAAVNGPAVGIGTTLLLHCDLVFSGDDAKFQMPFVNLGLCPEYASSYFLPRLMGAVKAAELILLGKTFGADEALQTGLVNEVLPAAEALEKARLTAAQLATQPPAAVRLSKQLLRRSTHETGLQVIREEGAHFQERLVSEEFKEAATAFMEKRTPDFSRFE